MSDDSSEKTTMIFHGMRMPPEQLERATKAAKAAGTNRSKLIREAIDFYLSVHMPAFGPDRGEVE